MIDMLEDKLARQMVWGALQGLEYADGKFLFTLDLDSNASGIDNDCGRVLKIFL